MRCEKPDIVEHLQVASGDTSPIPWNFAKFLVRQDGTVYGRCVSSGCHVLQYLLNKAAMY